MEFRRKAPIVPKSSATVMIGQAARLGGGILVSEGHPRTLAGLRQLRPVRIARTGSFHGDGSCSGLLMMSIPLDIAVGLSTVVLVWAEPDGSANVVGTARPGSSSVQIGSRSVPLIVNSRSSELPSCTIR